jgi:hypothetical protein
LYLKRYATKQTDPLQIEEFIHVLKDNNDFGWLLVHLKTLEITFVDLHLKLLIVIKFIYKLPFYFGREDLIQVCSRDSKRYS